MRRAWIERLEPPFLDVHAAQWAPGDEVIVPRRRPPLRELGALGRQPLGLGAAVDYALALGVDAIAERVIALAASLREQLAPRARVSRSTTAASSGAGS